jgi:hypothetical protein
MAQDIGIGNAGAALGAFFGGGKERIQTAARVQARSELARAFEQAAAGQRDQSVARLNEARASAQGQIESALIRAGMDPAKAHLAAMATIAASTSNPNQIIGAGQQLQAQEAGLGGDVQRMNIINSARTGTPLPMTKIEGNTAFNPNLAPGAQDLATTPLGQAMLTAANARAGASRASAGASGARERLLGTENTALLHPDQVPGASFNKPGKGNVAQPDMAALADVRARIAAGKLSAEKAAQTFTRIGRPDLAKKVYDPTMVFGGDGGD